MTMFAQFSLLLQFYTTYYIFSRAFTQILLDIQFNNVSFAVEYKTTMELCHAALTSKNKVKSTKKLTNLATKNNFFPFVKTLY